VPNDCSAGCATRAVPIKIASIKRHFINRRAAMDRKAAKHCRTPRHVRNCDRTFLVCVLECGGAPPLFIIARFAFEKTYRLATASPSGGGQDARQPHRQDVCATSVPAPEGLLC
jgi:hypothetical protein